MKALIIALMAFSTLGFSQESKTFFSNDDSETTTFGGYGGPLIQASNFNNDWGIVLGGKGGVVINKKFAIGGIGKALVSDVEFLGDNLRGNTNASLSFEYGGGGLFVEYLFKPENRVHFSIPVNLLGGGISVSEGVSDSDGAGDTEVESSGVFIIEPGINVEFNVSENFIPGINISYRQAIGSSLMNLSDQDISGVNVGLLFKFGKI